jgi:hypothetical protein
MQPTDGTSSNPNARTGRHRPPAARPDAEQARHHHELLTTLMRELFQTEQSAERHPTREADRLGDSAPAQALRAVASHAQRVLTELPQLTRDVELPDSMLGRGVGLLFSRVRDTIADKLVDAERSYRGTLLGMRHGVDLVKLIRHVADASGQVEIAGFATRWLEEREPLVAGVEAALAWFAQHPEVSVHSGAWGIGALRARRASQRS